MEKLGIENLKEVALFGINLAESVDKKLEDGKIGVFEGLDLLKDLKKLPKLIKAAPNAVDELKDLDADERKELVELVQKELDLRNDKVEQMVEKGIAAMANIAGLVDDFQSLK